MFTKLDVTKPEDAENSIKKVITTFGGIDILINNAGVSYKGYFEEMTIEDIRHQLEVNLIGSMNVTRAVLPVFRKQRKGLIITISSGAGIQGFEFSSAYAASKFAIEGWMDALQKEVEHFGINTMLVNPGFYRTELISDKSMSYADGSITDYDKLRDQQKQW